MTEMLELLRQYMNSWVNADKKEFLNTLADDIYLVECYGASYSTIREARDWFDDWNQKSKVLSWEITDTFYDDKKNVLIASWTFRDQMLNEPEHCFDGITVMHCENNKIIKLYEYEMTHERFYPYKKNTLQIKNSAD